MMVKFIGMNKNQTEVKRMKEEQELTSAEEKMRDASIDEPWYDEVWNNGYEEGSRRGFDIGFDFAMKDVPIIKKAIEKYGDKEPKPYIKRCFINWDMRAVVLHKQFGKTKDRTSMYTTEIGVYKIDELEAQQ
jgi:hypothetical protein